MAICVPAHVICLPDGSLAAIDAGDWEQRFTVEFKDGNVWAGCPSEVRWWTEKTKWGPYVYGSVFVPKRKHLALHRLLVSAKRGDVVDHKNCNGLDNRRENLRVCDNQRNSWNRRPTDGRLLPKGVVYRNRTGRYEVGIGYGMRRIHIGTFATPEEAGAAYDAKARELFGEFARSSELQAE
jgi:hypothetical protein